VSKRHVRLEREREAGRPDEDAVLLKEELVRLAAVVQARVQVEPQVHLAADTEDAPDQTMAMALTGGALNRHEVLDLAHPHRRQEAGDEDVRVREVELFGRPVRRGRRDSVVAAARAVEDRPEDARRIEARAAVPVDRAAGAHERDRVQVADHAVLGDRQVGAQRACLTHREDLVRFRQLCHSVAERARRQQG
jgi:hypothetical protein